MVSFDYSPRKQLLMIFQGHFWTLLASSWLFLGYPWPSLWPNLGTILGLADPPTHTLTPSSSHLGPLEKIVQEKNQIPPGN